MARAKPVIIRYESADGLSLEEEWKGAWFNNDTIIRSCMYPPLTPEQGTRWAFPSRRYRRLSADGYTYREIPETDD